MKPLEIVLMGKIIFTLFLWALPPLLFPKYATRLLGIPPSQPILFLRLLGAAYLALAVGYTLGLIDLYHGKEAQNTVWVGILSNGLAFIILLVYRSEWKRWGTRASVYMYSSTIATLLITLGLIVFGVIRN
jgi:hypothetical protein